MPNQDANVAPPGVEGPFSRFLNAPLEGKAAEEASKPDRPSGYLSKGGQLAYFGAQILKGLQQGKMQAYAQRENSKAQEYEAAANRVHALEQNEDVPQEVKDQARNLLAASWSMATKEQVTEAKKFHGKKGSGAGSHVLGFIEHLADTLGGQTPGEHSLGGAKDKDGKTPFSQLNELLADVHTGGDKYSTKAKLDKLGSQLAEAARPYQKDSNSQGAFGDPKVAGPLSEIYRLDPNRGKLAHGLLQESLRAPTPEEQLLRMQSKSGGGEQKQGGEEGQILPGIVGVTAQQQAETAETADKPAIQPGTPGSTFAPFTMPDGTVVSSPAEQQVYLQARGGTPQRSFFKKTEEGPNGKPTTTRREVFVYPKVPGIAVDVATGRRMDISGWQPTTATDHDTTQKPVMTKIKKAGPNGTVIEESVDITNGPVQYTPYRPPEHLRSGKAPDPIGQAMKELRLEESMEVHDEKKKKRNASALTDKIMSDAAADAVKHKVPIGKILDQRIDDFMGYYESDPRFAGNFDTVRESLLKRKGELAIQESKDVKKARDIKRAISEKAIPKPDSKANTKPAIVKPAVETSGKKTPPSPPPDVIKKLTPGKHTFGNGQVWIKKDDGTMDYVSG